MYIFYNNVLIHFFFKQQKEFQIKGAEEVIVSSIEDIMDLLREGESNRHYASTTMNHVSSRSHTIFRLVGYDLMIFIIVQNLIIYYISTLDQWLATLISREMLSQNLYWYLFEINVLKPIIRILLTWLAVRR